ncbi:PadR family transcriptional regulator [Phycicoccus sp. BSK3Z-2]|uniref:PadR family transcriptional regulator n=1 Tax=Phycicoccus avicenniae TaxID=2828860 RepID=A0A941I019_9MICO|nr:PadR family transcriptional regulator [Phycicoccus avicenniae]MBR7744713.1 PadR family transcriptional regulator [Phycicoccus avicenniae]
MSVRLGLMALLAEGDSYGARLRADFEARTGGTWPLNVGQVYTTLDRLVRDGLVEQAGEADDEGRIPYRLTDPGRAELGVWWTTPVDRSSTPRDELAIKLALAVTAPGVDVRTVVQDQRTSTLRHLRDLTRLKRDALARAEGSGERTTDGDGQPAEQGLAWLLVLENLVFAAEAEARWLDHVESTLARHVALGRPRPPAGPPQRTTPTADAASAHLEGNR